MKVRLRHREDRLSICYRVLYALGVIFIYSLFITESVYCFNISPQIVEVVLSPAEEYRGEYTVFNNGPDKIRIKITLEEFYNSEEAVEKKKHFSEGWISIFPSRLDIPPNESRRCKFKIKLPEQGSGEYKVNVFFQEISQKNRDEQIGIFVRFGAVIYAVVKNTEIVKGEIKNIQLLGTKPGRFGVTICNNGNVHTRPKGELVVKNRKTKRAFTILFNQRGSPVLPFSEEEIGAKGDINLEPGTYSVIAKIDYGYEYNGKGIKLIKRKFFIEIK